MKTRGSRYYMIIDESSGLKKTGGINNIFNTTGKLWLGGRVKTHLRQFDLRYLPGNTLLEKIKNYWSRRVNFDTCSVVEIELRVINSQPLEDFINEEMK